MFGPLSRSSPLWDAARNMCDDSIRKAGLRVRPSRREGEYEQNGQLERSHVLLTE